MSMLLSKKSIMVKEKNFRSIRRKKPRDIDDTWTAWYWFWAYLFWSPKLGKEAELGPGSFRSFETSDRAKIKSIKAIFTKELQNKEIQYEINQIKKVEEKVQRKDLICETNKHTYHFYQFETVRSFGDSIFSSKIKATQEMMPIKTI